MRIGRKTDLLSPEEREIVDRFERGAIDASEAGRLLIASVQRAVDGQPEASPPSTEVTEPAAAHEEAAPEEETAVDPNETPEEAAARLLVERIAREVDEELKR